MSKRLLLFVLTAAVLGFAPAPFPRRERANQDARRIEGTWVGPHRLVIIPGRLTYNPTTSPVVYGLVIDPTKTPATYDLKNAGGNGPPSWLGIYRVRGDVLTLCYNSASQGRPRAFEGPGKGAHIEIFKREGR